MKNYSNRLQAFSSIKLSKQELENTKGGLRFITYNEAEYVQVLYKLDIYSISYSNAASTDANGRTHYCIEW